jgi:NADPH2:quinone reductase
MQYLLSGQLEIIVGQTFTLEQAVEAHKAIAQRRTTGKVVLLV